MGDLPQESDVEEIRAAQIEDDFFFPTRESHDDFLSLDTRHRRGRSGSIAARCKGYDLPRFVTMLMSLLLIGPAKRLVDLEVRSFHGEHTAFFEALADRVGKL